MNYTQFSLDELISVYRQSSIFTNILETNETVWTQCERNDDNKSEFGSTDRLSDEKGKSLMFFFMFSHCKKTSKGNQ